MKRISLSVVLGLALACLGTAVYASRNASGTYTLPSGNPVVTRSLITTTWANGTLGDLAGEMTNSLDRTGKGAMQAPLMCVDGTFGAPALSFTNSPTSGLYKAGTNLIGMAAGGNVVQQWGTASSIFYLPLVSSPGTVGGTGVTGNGGPTSGDGVHGVGNGTGVGGDFTGGSSGNGTGLRAIGGGSGMGGDFTGGSGGNGIGLRATGSGSGVGAVIVGGLQVGTSGTSISASYGASYTIDFNALFGAGAAGTSYLSSQTLTGVATGGVCAVSVDGNINSSALSCYVSAGNTVQIKLTLIAGVLPGSGPYRVRVFQP